MHNRIILVFVMIAPIMGAAQTTRLSLQQDLSSKLPSGTEFSAEDSTGRIYRGYIVTHPARRLLRRGSLLLVFKDPVIAITKDREGVIRPGNKMRLLKLGGSMAAAKLADDSVDGAIGATKARYVGGAVAALLAIFQKGGEAKLHAGDTIDVEPRERSAGLQ